MTNPVAINSPLIDPLIAKNKNNNTEALDLPAEQYKPFLTFAEQTKIDRSIGICEKPRHRRDGSFRMTGRGLFRFFTEVSSSEKQGRKFNRGDSSSIVGWQRPVEILMTSLHWSPARAVTILRPCLRAASVDDASLPMAGNPTSGRWSPSSRATHSPILSY